MPNRSIDLPAITWVQVLDEEGNLDEDLEPEIPEDDLRELYRTMVLSREVDQRRLKLQRQGRIGTFAPAMGQEAAQLGSVYPLEATDWVVPSFRELTVALWRGAKLENDLLYAAGYEEGVEIPPDGRDLPIAIPVGSQIIHGTGLAWAAKLKGDDAVAVTYFGDGATSEGDFHEGLNFAAVFATPTIFFCQNNQFAISVPREKQTKAGTLAQKAVAYDMPGVQVDGNDILGVIRVMREAVERARAGEGPTLIEAVTYRLSVHTTADDPKRYREEDEVEDWEHRDPIPRFRSYLLEKGVLEEGDHETIVEECREEIGEAVEAFEEMLGPDPVDMFDHAYAENPPWLEMQKAEFTEALERGDVNVESH